MTTTTDADFDALTEAEQLSRISDKIDDLRREFAYLLGYVKGSIGGSAAFVDTPAAPAPGTADVAATTTWTPSVSASATLAAADARLDADVRAMAAQWERLPRWVRAVLTGQRQAR
jgi:hypothetical protein